MGPAQRTALWILVLVGGLSAWGAHHWMQTQEARKLSTILEPYFTSEAADAWEALSLSSRVETGRRALPAIEALQGTSWGITITDLRADGEERARETVFRLEAGDTELVDCTVSSPAGDPAGACARFRHIVPSAGAEPRLQAVPVALHLNDRPYAESTSSARLSVGASSGVQVEGTVRIDEQDVSVRDPVLLLPSPRLPEQIDRVSVEAFSPRTELTLRSTQNYPFEIAYDMPAPLAPFFDGADRLRVIYAEVATSVDLTAETPVYRLEGMLEIMNQRLGRTVLEYQPGQYAAAAVTGVSIPTALPGVCLNIDQALVEVDFAQERLRVAGGTRTGTVDSFLCRQAGVGESMGTVTRFGLGFALDAARESFGLPPEWDSQGQIVLDLNDGILCGDLAVQGTSLFHASYFGKESTFRMWAPLDILENDIRPDRPLGSIVNLGVGAITADWSFPDSSPRKCWDGDEGPHIDLDRTILAGWPSE